jgi:hypothetical protein
MVQFSEADLCDMLERRAAEFAAAPVPSDTVLRRARRRKARNLALAGGAMLAVAALAGLSTSLPRASDTGVGSAAGGASLPRPASGHLRLVDYAVRAPAGAGEHAPSGRGPVITIDDVRKHVQCMRSQGFDLPEPTRQPGGGWSVVIDHPKARGLDFRSRAFREAEFVTCGPLGGPLSGDIVIGGPRPKIDRFMNCMSRRGFNLPEPTMDRWGRYDTDEWQFDLTRTGIDTSTPAWNRAMFVTCAPDGI